MRKKSGVLSGEWISWWLYNCFWKLFIWNHDINKLKRKMRCIYICKLVSKEKINIASWKVLNCLIINRRVFYLRCIYNILVRVLSIFFADLLSFCFFKVFQFHFLSPVNVRHKAQVKFIRSPCAGSATPPVLPVQSAIRSSSWGGCLEALTRSLASSLPRTH